MCRGWRKVIPESTPRTHEFADSSYDTGKMSRNLLLLSVVFRCCKCQDQKDCESKFQLWLDTCFPTLKEIQSVTCTHFGSSSVRAGHHEDTRTNWLEGTVDRINVCFVGMLMMAQCKGQGHPCRQLPDWSVRMEHWPKNCCLNFNRCTAGV